MKISILKSNLYKKDNNFDDYIANLTNKLSKNKHEVALWHLEEMYLKYCTGCWTCWWETPGLCVLKDEGEKLFRSVIHADFVLFASPLSAGFISSTLKKITDRLIVLLHPYILLKNGECHHHKRYDKYPKFGLLLEKEPDTDNEDLKIITDMYKRFAINFHSELCYLKTIENPIKEVIENTNKLNKEKMV